MALSLGDIGSLLALPISFAATAVAFVAYRKGDNVQTRLLALEEERAAREKESHAVAMKTVTDATKAREQVQETLALEIAREFERSRTAELSAEYSRDASGRPVLIIANTGLAIAREIGLEVDGQVAPQIPRLIDQRQRYAPLATGERHVLRMVNADGAPRQLRIRLTWDDDSVSGTGEWHRTIHLDG